MIDTLLLAFTIFVLAGFVIYKIVKPKSISNSHTIVILGVNLSVIVFLIINTGFEKLNSDILRLLHNSRPKAPEEIYSVLFKMPKDSCVAIVKIKDQVIPKIDCCIWMEIEICKSELEKILSSKKYQTSIFHLRDRTLPLEPFDGRPDWWNLQFEGDSIVKTTIRFNENNQQSLFFGKDSSRVYICDQAL